MNNNLNDCFVAISIDLTSETCDYTNRSKKLIESVLNYTDKSILLITNRPERYEQTNPRFILKSLSEVTNESVISGTRFNMHLKRLAIAVGYEAGYSNIIYCDCDVFFNEWNEDVYQQIIQQDFDIAYKGGTLLKDLMGHKAYQLKVEEFGDLWYEDLGYSCMMCEALILFKNNSKLEVFLDFWNRLAQLAEGKNYFTYYDTVYFGTAAKHANMKILNFKEHFGLSYPFSKQFFIQHGANGANIIKY